MMLNKIMMIALCALPSLTFGVSPLIMRLESSMNSTSCRRRLPAAVPKININHFWKEIQHVRGPYFEIAWDTNGGDIMRNFNIGFVEHRPCAEKFYHGCRFFYKEMTESDVNNMRNLFSRYRAFLKMADPALKLHHIAMIENTFNRFFPVAMKTRFRTGSVVVRGSQIHPSLRSDGAAQASKSSCCRWREQLLQSGRRRSGFQKGKRDNRTMPTLSNSPSRSRSSSPIPGRRGSNGSVIVD